MQPYAMLTTHRNRELSGSQFPRVRSRLRVRDYVKPTSVACFGDFPRVSVAINPSSYHKYGSFVYWLGQRPLKPQKVRSELPRVTTLIERVKCDNPTIQWSHLYEIPRKSKYSYKSNVRFADLKQHLTEATIVATSVVHVIATRKVVPRGMQQ